MLNSDCSDVLVCNPSSVITSPILLSLREVFLIYCINRGKCKSCSIRNLAFSADVKLILFLSALTRRMWCRSGQCILCFPLLLVAIILNPNTGRCWGIAEFTFTLLSTSQFCWPCAWDVGRDRNPVIPRDRGLSSAPWDNSLTAASSSPTE